MTIFTQIVYFVPIVAIIALLIKKYKTKTPPKHVQFSNIMDILVFTKSEPLTPRRRKRVIKNNNILTAIKKLSLRRKSSLDMDPDEEQRLQKSILKYSRRKSF